MNTLDKIIEVATKANAAINIIAPGAGTIGTLGLALTKFIVQTVNDARAANSPALVLPADDVLIARLEATATRIVDTGEAFLADPSPAPGA